MKKDKYGEIAITASDDVCEKCEYITIDWMSKECTHCDKNLNYNEYYKTKKNMSSKIKVKVKSWNFQSIETKIYLNRQQGWKLVKRYQNCFGRYIAVMTKTVVNG